ncbi:hypothetical protein BaRGS_00001619 [Batillaria attramentaria]|uniref:RING-type domain-containing protein n=1 Tax=Batillaria attramentaria TaxID=370345 RepID=A0ABD0M8E5_9CAEN
MSVFEVSKFDPQPNPELICCICYCVLHQPRECRCRHVFCKKCIETWLSNHFTCPTCRTTVRFNHLQPVLPLVQNMLNNLTMICDFHEHGCQDKITMEQYENHIKTCQFQTVVCPNFGCGLQVPKNTLTTHAQECPFKSVMCEQGCDLRMQQQHADSHNCLTALKDALRERNTVNIQYRVLLRWLWGRIRLMQQVEGPPRLQARYFRDILNQIARFWPPGQEFPPNITSPTSSRPAEPNGAASDNHINIDEEISQNLGEPSLLVRLMEEASATGARERERTRRVFGPRSGSDEDRRRRSRSGGRRSLRNRVVLPDGDSFFDTAWPDSAREFVPYSGRGRSSSRSPSQSFSSTSVSTDSSESVNFTIDHSSQASQSTNTTQSLDDDDDTGDNSQGGIPDDTDREVNVVDSDSVSEENEEDRATGSRTEGSTPGSVVTDNNNNDSDSYHSDQSLGGEGNTVDGDAGSIQSPRSSSASDRASSASGINSDFGPDSSGPDDHGPRSGSEGQGSQLDEDEDRSPIGLAEQQRDEVGGPRSPDSEPRSPQSPSGEPRSPAVSSHSEISYNSNGPQFSSDNSMGSDDANAENNSTHTENNSLSLNNGLWDSSSRSENTSDGAHYSDHDADNAALAHSDNNSGDGSLSDTHRNADNARTDVSHAEGHVSVSSATDDNRPKPCSSPQPDASVDDHDARNQDEGKSHELQAVPSSNSTERDSGFASLDRMSDISDKDSGTLPQQAAQDDANPVSKTVANSESVSATVGEPHHNAWDSDSDTTSLDYGSDHAGDDSAAPSTSMMGDQVTAVSDTNANTATVVGDEPQTSAAENQEQPTSQEPEVSTSGGQPLVGSSSSDDDEEDKPEKRQGKGKGKSACKGKGKALSARKQVRTPTTDSGSDVQMDSGVVRKRKLHSIPLDTSSDSEPSSSRPVLPKKLCLTLVKSVPSSRNEDGDEANNAPSTTTDNPAASWSFEGNGDGGNKNSDNSQRKSPKKKKTAGSEKSRKRKADDQHSSFSKQTQTCSATASTSTNGPSTSSGTSFQAWLNFRDIGSVWSFLENRLEGVVRELVASLPAAEPTVTSIERGTALSPTSPPPEPPPSPRPPSMIPLQEPAVPVVDRRLLNPSVPPRARSPVRERSPVSRSSAAAARSRISSRSRSSHSTGAAGMTLRDRRGRSRDPPPRSRGEEDDTRLVRIPDIPVPPSTYQLLNMYANDDDSDSTWSPASPSHDSD